jgi:hypothetical protein
VAGVDDGGGPGVQVDAHELTGDELPVGGVLGEGLVGVVGLLGAVTARALDQVGRGQADDRAAAEVGDEEGHRLSVDHLPEGGGHRLHRVDRGRGLDLLQECADVDQVSLRAAHLADPRRRCDSPWCVDVSTRQRCRAPSRRARQRWMERWTQAAAFVSQKILSISAM